TRVGLAVPTYVDVESLRELNTISGKVGGKIYGIEKTAGLTNSTNIAIREYDLKFKQTNRDTAYMLNALEKAIEAEEPIVVAAWSPHWMFARYDLRMLHDPVNVFVEDGIRKCARKGFAAEQPEAALFLKRFALNEGQLNALLLEIYESDTDPRDVARKWIAKNPEIVEAWTAPEKKKGFFKRLFN
ncbi:MAG: glycine betaine ABC transporter substrate-binding protein, partial [Coraliomargarita sp.]